MTSPRLGLKRSQRSRAARPLPVQPRAAGRSAAMPKLLVAASALSSLLGADAAFVPQPMTGGHEPQCASSAHSCRSRQVQLVSTMEEAGFGIKTAGKMTRDERLRSRYAGLAYEPEDGWLGDSAEFSYDELAMSMNTIPTFARGDLTTGSVIGFEPNGALVDIGVKSSAYVTVRAAADSGGERLALHSADCPPPLRRAAARAICPSDATPRRARPRRAHPGPHAPSPPLAPSRRRKRWRSSSPQSPRSASSSARATSSSSCHARTRTGS